jgi:hypothetical protein
LFARVEQGIARRIALGQSVLVTGEASSIVVRCRLGSVGSAAHLHHNAIDWAAWQAQLTASAELHDYCVQQALCPDDGIGGAGWQATRTTNAAFGVDPRDRE